jgi:Ca2+-binding EF-hand superfamily protein
VVTVSWNSRILQKSVESSPSTSPCCHIARLRPDASLLPVARFLDSGFTASLFFSNFVRIDLVTHAEFPVSERILARDPMEEIRRAFQLFDDDNTGKISLRNLRRVAKEIGDRLEDDEL